MEFHVLELPKLPNELKEDSSDIELWGKFIRAERKEEFDLLAEKNIYIGSAYKHLQIISQDKQKRMEYEAREKAVRDYNQGMLEAEQRGEDRGQTKGEEKATIRIAKNLLSSGLSVDMIAKNTGLTIEQVEALK